MAYVRVLARSASTVALSGTPRSGAARPSEHDGHSGPPRSSRSHVVAARIDSANSASLKLVMRTGLAGVRSSECSKPDLLLEQSSARALPAYT